MVRARDCRIEYSSNIGPHAFQETACYTKSLKARPTRTIAGSPYVMARGEYELG
jgi:hypothetical protein